MLSLWVLSLAVASGTAERLPIVDRAIDFHGGALYESTRTRLSLCSKSGCFEVEAAVWDGRYSYRVAGRARSGERVVGITNTEVRHWLNGQPVPVVAEQETALRDWVMERVYFCFLPYRLNDPSVVRHDLGVESWEGRRLHRVKVTFVPGSSTDAQDEYLYWFDPDSGRLEQFAYSYQRGEGGLRFRRAVNHRRVGGLLFFDQENLGRDGGGLSVDRIDPLYVERELSPISRVELRRITVEPLGSPPLPPGLRSGGAEGGDRQPAVPTGAVR